MATETYRCLRCQEHTVTRAFDVSHISVTCPVCGSFERLVNERVVERFRGLEESPPESLDWHRLGRREKLFVAERVVRRGRDPSEFTVEGVSDDAGVTAGRHEGPDDETAESAGEERGETPPTTGDEPTPD